MREMLIPWGEKEDKERRRHHQLQGAPLSKDKSQSSQHRLSNTKGTGYQCYHHGFWLGPYPLYNWKKIPLGYYCQVSVKFQGQFLDLQKIKTVDLLSILLFDTTATAEQPDQKRKEQ